MLTFFYKKKLYIGFFSFCNKINYSNWDISAVGSAQHWQCWGQGFESPMFQIIKLNRKLVYYHFFN